MNWWAVIIPVGLALLAITAQWGAVMAKLGRVIDDVRALHLDTEDIDHRLTLLEGKLEGSQR